MTYTCKNNDCSAPENKKGRTYPSAMDCPFCDSPLVEDITLTEIELNLINELPYVIAYPLRRAITENHSWSKINLLKDTFLNYLKYMGLITASEFFNSSLKNKSMVALFQQALSEPSFGSWNQYIRETIQYLQENNHNFFNKELVDYYEKIESGKKRKIYKGDIEYIDSSGDILLKKQYATAIGMLINFRNRYLGHGLTLDELEANKLWKEYYPIFTDLLVQMKFTLKYPMYKHEHGESYLLKSAIIIPIEKGKQNAARVWIENPQNESLDILPFFVVPGEVSLKKEDKEQLLAYESHTGKTIKFFSPEGTEKQTSGKILEKLNLLLREKQNEKKFSPTEFSKEVLKSQIKSENKLILDSLIAEKKIIPDIYVNRKEIEFNLREFIGAKANIYFIAAEAGSGKTNLLVEMQRQYDELGLTNLLITANRMERQSIKEQIKHLLNLQSEVEIEKYSSIAGTQAQPTLFLIDGLNEASNPELLWSEILDLCEIFAPGSIKFIITNRSNSILDLKRYFLPESSETRLYGEKKDGEVGLPGYSNWLTALNMDETQNAWNNYTQKHKNRYKPIFKFNDLASYDRAVYNQINNPLVLRLFLETYHGKKLPFKLNKHINIWQDWLSSFTEEEALFFKLLAEEIWNKGENELLIDDLLNNPNLKKHITSDLITSPYPRLKNLGWITRYVKDLNSYLSFTVEGALGYMLGDQLSAHKSKIDINYINELLSNGNRLHRSGLESFLCQQALLSDLEIISQMVDEGGDKLDICIRPLLYFMKINGAEETISRLLKKPTDNDWNALINLLELLEELQLKKFKEELTYKTFEKSIELSIDLPLKVKMSLLEDLKHPENELLLEKIETEIKEVSQISSTKSTPLKEELAFYLTFNGAPEKAIQIYKELYNLDEIRDPSLLNKIGAAFDLCNLLVEAKSCYQSALNLSDASKEKDLKRISMLYFNLAPFQETEDEKLEFYMKALDIDMKLYGYYHLETIRTHSAIGSLYLKQNKFDLAFEKLNEVLETTEKLGADLTEVYEKFGLYYLEKKDFDKSYEFYEKALMISIAKYGESNSLLINKLTNIGAVLEQIGDDNKSLLFFKRADEIISKTKYTKIDSLVHIKHYIGFLNLHSDNFVEAINYLREAIKLYDNDESQYMRDEKAKIYYHLGYSLYFNGEYESANIALENLHNTSIENSSTDDYVQNFELIGNSFFYTQKYKNAIDSYNKILNYLDNKEKLKTLQLIGSCFEHLNLYEDAIKTYFACLDIESNDNETESIQYRIAVCNYTLKHYKNALEILLKCTKNSENEFYTIKIAECYEAIDEKQNALNAYIKTIEIISKNALNNTNNEIKKKSLEKIKVLARKLGKENDLPPWIKNVS